MSARGFRKYRASGYGEMMSKKLEVELERECGGITG